MPHRHASAAPDSDPAPELIADATPERVSVLLPLPLLGPYDYLAPEDMPLEEGAIVQVPLGKRELHGVVWDRPETEGESVPLAKMKPVIDRFPVPPLNAELRRFVEWVSTYTLAPLGSVLRMAVSVPQALEPPRPIALVSRSDGPLAEDLRLTPARHRVLAELEDGPARPAAEVARAAGVSGSVVKGLLENGALKSESVIPVASFPMPQVDSPGPTLSEAQAEAAGTLRDAVRDKAFLVTLLDGVTGSGKTEVYLEAVAETLRLGRQAVVLLPEIALSAQWLARFERRFGVRPAVWHSDMTQVQRRRTWRAIAEGRAPVVVGARSALFLPYRNLGLIVVDEEHDPAFKQEDGVIYQARDMAVVRASIAGIPIALVSATPSLETVMNVRSGRYRELSLPERHGAAQLPQVDIVDLREDKPAPLERPGEKPEASDQVREDLPSENAPRSAMPGWLSGTLRAAVEKNLGAGEQTLLFLNRRGYAPLTLCRACGHRLQCPNCTAWLVEHRLAGRLQCHHCGYWVRLPEACPDCGAEGKLAACGPGVERLAEEVSLLFPDARMAVMASDTLGGPQAVAELVEAVQAREIDILIGTQIAAKGHHFPYLTLVGVIDADLGLFGGDLRAAERTYQLLHQVAGRAGRESAPGRVLLQTLEPGHPVIQALVSGDRDRFMEAEIAQRKLAQMPPFGRLAALILSGPDYRQLDGLAAHLARKAPRGAGIQVLGPAPAPLAILRGQHRRRFLLKTAREIAPQPLVKEWLSGVKLPNAVRLQIDIDPYSFL